MALQNRVTPFGEIVTASWRGQLTGNRGIVHDPATRTLHATRRWSTKAWVYCLCDFKNRKRDVMGANGPNGSAGWTNLFFTDEAVALATGHRPCFYCQRDRAKAFQVAWAKGKGGDALPAPAMDGVLHTERLEGRSKRFHTLSDFPSDLPDGVFLTDGESAYVIAKASLVRWHNGQYQSADPAPTTLRLLTPPSTVRAIQAGFAPHIAVDF